MSETLYPRIYGSEVEYGYKYEPGKLRDKGGLTADYLRLCLPEDVYGVKSFLNNGGRFYIDVGGHPEYATPECATIEDLVIHELAGEIIVADTLEEAQRRNYVRNIQLNKRVADKGKWHWGAHENYYVDNEITDEMILLPLAMHYATRSIWAGAGMMKNGHFYVAQKMESVEVLDRNFTHSPVPGNRPLINLLRSKVDPLTNGQEGRRIHITSGDANVWPWALKMKFGTTSLVLRLIEHGEDLSDLILEDPIRVARGVAADPALRLQLRTQQGKYMTALDIQEELAIRAARLAERIRLPDEEMEVLSEWLMICDDLRSDQDDCGDRVEWVAKKQVIDGVQNRRGLDRHDPILPEVDIRWDIIHPVERLGYGVRLREQEKVKDLPDMLDIERAVTTPPEDTRARIRGNFVMAMAMRKMEAQAEWCRLGIPGIKKGYFSIADPFTSRHHRLERTLRMLHEQ